MRTRVVAVCLLGVLCVPAISRAQLRADVVASGLSMPLAVVPDPVIPGVFFIVEQDGLVRVAQNGQLLPTPFLDLRNIVETAGNEQGLLGLAFSPNAASGRVFVNFVDGDGDTVVARFRRAAANPLVADPATRFDLRWSSGERVIRQPFDNHNGGNLLFGPDGYLYVGLGDGGSNNDPQNNAQNPATLLGKILRIDVNVAEDDPNGYRIPPDNPFVDAQPIPALAEIWDFGVRNPWRFSFDDFGAGATGALIIADVGQNAREEINYEPAGAGGRNYGWRIREGTIATPGVSPTSPAFGPLIEPIFDFAHPEARSITGGFVYRGTALGAIYHGRYFFADFIRSRVWSLGLAINPITREAVATGILEHTSELGGSSFLGGIASFGRDLQGELYLTTFTGRILRIAAAGGGTPNAPTDLRAEVTADSVTISWSPPASGPASLQYRLEAGSIPGASNLGTVVTTQTALTFPGVPPGTYFVRVRGLNAGGAGAASEEITVVVGGSGCTAPPPAPTSLIASLNGASVTLAWALAASPNPATSQTIEAGSASGLADLATLTLDGAARTLTVVAPGGRYFVRLRARNACGVSGPSNEIVVDVP